MFNLFKHEFISRRWAIIGWGIGLALLGSMYIAIFPEVAEEMAGLADLIIYQLMGVDLGSFAGYIASVVVNILPVMLGVYVIMTATATLAGEEENGTLELIVAMPLPRWQIIVVKTLAIAVALFSILTIMGIICVITLTFVKQTVEVDITSGQLFVALMAAMPLMLSFTTITLFLSSLLPSRRLALGVMAVFYLASYFAESMSVLVESLEFLKTFSLFNYFDTSTNVFTEGVKLSDVTVLLVVSLIFFALTIVSFQRRNITVGQWSWQRGQAPA